MLKKVTLRFVLIVAAAAVVGALFALFERFTGTGIAAIPAMIIAGPVLWLLVKVDKRLFEQDKDQSAVVKQRPGAPVKPTLRRVEKRKWGIIYYTHETIGDDEPPLPTDAG